MGFGVSGSSGSSDSSSRGESGVSGPDRALATGGAFDVLQGLGPQIASFLQNVPQLNLTNGLTPGVSGLANQLVTSSANSLFNRLSSSGALRGQLRPANTSAIIGSASERAATSVLPQLTTQAQNNELFNVTSQQNTQAQGLAFLQNLAGLFTGLTKGSSQSSEGTASNSSFGFAVK